MMPIAMSNGLPIAYNEHGDEKNPPMLLVQGLGLPSTAWPPEFIDCLIQRSLRVITFDNRDTGQSGQIQSRPRNMLWQFLRQKMGLGVSAPYRLDDMMTDALGLLDALRIESAHVVGISMGGMIAQLMAIHAPARVRSLTSIMSTTGNRRLPGPSRKIVNHMLRRPPETEPGLRNDYYHKLWELIGSPDYPTSKERRQQFLQRVFERGITAAGSERQLLAIMASPDRVNDLNRIKLPTLVIHGEADPLVPLLGGIETANAIPESTFTTIPGMGHDLPVQLIPRIVEMLADHSLAVESKTSSEKVA